MPGSGIRGLAAYICSHHDGKSLPFVIPEMFSGVTGIPCLVEHNTGSTLTRDRSKYDVNRTNKMDCGKRRVAGKRRKRRMGAWMRRVSKGRDLFGE